MSDIKSHLTDEKKKEYDKAPLNDKIIMLKAFNPFWLFQDTWEGEDIEPGVDHYWCFIGAHYPGGLVSDDKDKYSAAITDLDNGSWLANEKKAKPDKAIGWGNAKTPSEAFRSALRCAGFLKDRSKDNG